MHLSIIIFFVSYFRLEQKRGVHALPKFKFKSARNNKKINLIECKNDIFDNERLRGAHIEIFSNKEIIIDGCFGIYEYSECYVKLNLCKGALAINGSMINVQSFENDMITLKGTFSSIEFC